jgi:hypothetical protein
MTLEPVMTSPAPDLRLRLRVFLTRVPLDRRIAGGESIEDSGALSLRAAQLAERSSRTATACVLANILAAAQERRDDPASQLFFDHAAVLEASDGIAELIELLRGDAALTPRALALASLLATDADSPIVSAAAGRTVRDALAEIVAAL